MELTEGGRAASEELNVEHSQTNPMREYEDAGAQNVVAGEPDVAPREAVQKPQRRRTWKDHLSSEARATLTGLGGAEEEGSDRTPHVSQPPSDESNSGLSSNGMGADSEAYRRERRTSSSSGEEAVLDAAETDNEDTEESKTSAVLNNAIDSNIEVRRKRRKVIRLRDLLVAKAEVDGLAHVGVSTLGVIVALLIPVLLLYPGSSQTRSDVVESMAEYTSVGGDDYAFADVKTPQDVLSYTLGLYRAWLVESLEAGYENEQVIVGRTKMKVFQIAFTYEHTSDALGSQSALKSLNSAFKKNGRAYDIPDLSCLANNDDFPKRMFCFMGVYIFPHNRSSALGTLSLFENSFLDLFAPALVHCSGKGLAQNPESPTDGAKVQLGALNSFDDEKDTGTYGIGVLPYRTTGMYSGSTRDVFRLLLEIAFGFIFFYGIYDELLDLLRTRGALGAWTLHYHSMWNILDALNIILVIFGIYGYYYMYALPMMNPIFELETWNKPSIPKSRSWTPDSAPRLLGLSTYIWLGNGVLTGFRWFKHLRFHRGVSVYIKVFFKTAEIVTDFAVWFFAIIILLTIAFFYFFAITGGNSDFTGFASALNTIGLMTMGYYDYETLVNSGYGFGPEQVFIVIVMFWLLMILCIIFAQNIILATVGKAYDEASEEAEGTRPFYIALVDRFYYSCLHFQLPDQLRDKCVPWRDKLSCQAGACCSEARTEDIDSYAKVKAKASEARRNERHNKWSAVLHRRMEPCYRYFQHPLYLEPEFGLWLWDQGGCVKRADATLKRQNEEAGGIWRGVEDDWDDSEKAAKLLDKPLALDQFKEIVVEINLSEELRLYSRGLLWFWRNRKGNATAGEDSSLAIKCGSLFGSLFEEEGAASDEELAAFSDRIFNAFAVDEDIQEEDSHDAAVLIQKNKRGVLFLNKRRNLMKTAYKIEDDVTSLRDTVKGMKYEQDLMRIQIQELAACTIKAVAQLSTIAEAIKKR